MRLGTVTVLAFAFAAVLSATGLAADATPTPAASPSDDSITAAKRELDQLKQATTAGAIDGRSGTLPSVAIPQVHTDDEPMIIPPPQDPTKLKRKQSSANWLVDGVMNAKREDDKATDRAAPGRRPNRDAADLLSANNSELHFGADAEKSLDPEKLTDAPKSADAPPPPRPDTVFNPLSQYMASWMTPQDYSLLRPGIDKRASGSGVEASPAPSAPGTESGALAALAGIGGETFAAPKTSYAPIAPTENPFLSGLSLPDMPPPTSSAPVPPPTSTQPSFPLVTPPPSQEPEHSTIPDFAKPSDDDKYLKPLKRF